MSEKQLSSFNPDVYGIIENKVGSQSERYARLFSCRKTVTAKGIGHNL